MRTKTFLFAVVWCLAFGRSAAVLADPVAVRFPERPASNSLVLSSLDGKQLATGTHSQDVRSGRVTSHVVFRFADGSIHDETTVFSQRDVFRLLTYRLIQQGPSFRWTLDMTMNAETGEVVIRHKEKEGRERISEEKLSLPEDVGNGMMVSVLKNLASNALPAAASFVAAIPEPRPVKLGISSLGAEPVRGRANANRAIHYVIKAQIGGLAGFFAPLVGKQPPDTHVWILDGPEPAYVKSEGTLFYGGPIWRIELVGPAESGGKP